MSALRGSSYRCFLAANWSATATTYNSGYEPLEPASDAIRALPDLSPNLKPCFEEFTRNNELNGAIVVSNANFDEFPAPTEPTGQRRVTILRRSRCIHSRISELNVRGNTNRRVQIFFFSTNFSKTSDAPQKSSGSTTNLK